MIVLPETIQLCPYLTALLAEAEDLPELIETQGHERVLDSLLDKMEQDALRAADTTTMMAVLRRCKRRAAFLIALADLTGVWTLEETTLALSRLAESAVLQAVRFLLKGMAKEGLLILPDPKALGAVLTNLMEFDPLFNIVTP